MIKSPKENNPILIEVDDSDNKIQRPIKDKNINNNDASRKLILCDAIGRSFVLETLLSRLRSKISLITHPAPRITIDPKRNKIIRYEF